MQKELIRSAIALASLCVTVLAIRGAVELFKDDPPPPPSCQKFGYADFTTVVMNLKTDLLIIQCIKKATANETQL